jgi:hypothetical protein
VPVHVQQLSAVCSDGAVLPRDEIDMDDVDSAPEDQVWGAGIRPRDERKDGSAAAPGVAFPAEPGTLEM